MTAIGPPAHPHTPTYTHKHTHTHKHTTPCITYDMRRSQRLLFPGLQACTTRTAVVNHTLLKQFLYPVFIKWLKNVTNSFQHFEIKISRLPSVWWMPRQCPQQIIYCTCRSHYDLFLLHRKYKRPRCIMSSNILWSALSAIQWPLS